MKRCRVERGRMGPGSTTNPGDCICGRLSGYTLPCVLLLLAERPSYGYELVERLKQDALDPDCSGHVAIYRTLRRLEVQGMVESQWETGKLGPDRRLYNLTNDGWRHLADWKTQIVATINHLQDFEKRYNDLSGLKDGLKGDPEDGLENNLNNGLKGDLEDDLNDCLNDR